MMMHLMPLNLLWRNKMQIIVFVIAFAVLGIFIPRKYFKIYMYFTAIVLSSIYLFFVPSYKYDLYRHYGIYESFEDFTLSEMFQDGNDVIRLYVAQYPVYTIILLFLSRFHIKELLPFLTGVIVYSLSFNMLSNIENDVKKKVPFWQIRIGYVVILLCYNFIAISGVRNILASVIFAYTLYCDLTKKKSPLFCGIVYVLCIFIHATAGVYLMLRIAMLAYKKIGKLPIAIGVFSIFFITGTFYEELYDVFGNIPGITTLLKLFHDYTNGSGGTVLLGNLYMCIGLYLVTFMTCIFAKKYCFRDNIELAKYDRIADYTILLVLFAFGSYSQYDIFARCSMIVLPLYSIILVLVIRYMQPVRITHITGKKMSIVLMYAGVMVVSFVVLSCYCIYNFSAKYFEVTDCISLSNLFRN